MGRKKKFNDHPFPYRTEIELEITTLTNLGVGLGRVTLPGAPRADAGWVVMVPFTLPGERVRARVYRNHKNFSEGDLLEVLTSSPHRVAAPCPLFGRCGGCQYQHLTYAEQLNWKRRQVEELLQHLAGVTFPVSATIPSPREYGYRSKITPHFQVRGARSAERGTPETSSASVSPELQPGNSADDIGAPPIGFLKQGTRFELIDVPACPIATPEINAKLTEVRAETRRKLAAGDYARGATLLLRHAQEGVVTDYDAIIHEVVAPLEDNATRDRHPADAARGPEQVCNVIRYNPAARPSEKAAEPRHIIDGKDTGRASLRLHFLARDFFQNNPFILPAFTGYVREQAAATGARLMVDAYCGSGLFALSCAPAFTRVAGVEVSASSVQFARENAAANGITNATFSAGDAATIFAGLDQHVFVPDDTVVVIDPPRKGCDESFLEQLFAFGPRAVVYVSCDPATQMRDLKRFLAAGYDLTAVQPFDLFPQTRHLECVITLRKL